MISKRRHPLRVHHGLCIIPLVLAACAAPAVEETATTEAPLSVAGYLDLQLTSAGLSASASSTGSIDRSNAFFQSLGTNGRTCESCHHADEGWSMAPSRLRARFEATGGTDPVFLPHDGANAPTADVSTVDARRAAYSLLLSRGVIRVGLPVKPTSDFILVAADDPYGWATAAQLSMFRRPLPTTNLRFLTTINWDGRNTPAAELTNIHLGLKNQSNGATVNHAKAAAPIDDAVRESIVGFESAVTTALVWHDAAGPLSVAGATGGPHAILGYPFADGLNDPTQPGFTNKAFTLYDAWASDRRRGGVLSARADIAEGQRLFNEKTFDTGSGRIGTCSGCHSMPNVGGGSAFRFFDVGISSAQRRASDVPLYTFQNIATGETIQTTDAGRALISGKWADMNRFKVPGLRGLATRAPYFHDGSVQTISAVVDHYQQHFGHPFTDVEKRKLVMFLEAL